MVEFQFVLFLVNKKILLISLLEFLFLTKNVIILSFSCQMYHSLWISYPRKSSQRLSLSVPSIIWSDTFPVAAIQALKITTHKLSMLLLVVLLAFVDHYKGITVKFRLCNDQPKTPHRGFKERWMPNVTIYNPWENNVLHWNAKTASSLLQNSPYSLF